MWCELVLNGIGGRTIAEAKRNIGYSEFMKWREYRHKRGSLNVGLRVEEMLAMFMSLYANSKSPKSKLTFYAFAPHFDEPEIDLIDLFKNK